MDNLQLLVLLACSPLVGLLANRLIQHLPNILAREWQIKLPHATPVKPGWIFSLSIGCALVAAYGPNDLLPGIFLMLAASLLMALAFIDWQHQWLPDCLTLPLLWSGLAVNLFALFVPLQEAVLGAMLGYFILWSLNRIYQCVRGKPGIGYGDFKLLAALGAWAGWNCLPMILLLAAGSALLFSWSSLGRKTQTLDTPLAFGSYLAATGWLVLAFRDYLPLFN